jgi:hypothetical protein
MANFDQAGDTVRKIAGYLPYNPGPGIYSRLERAVEQMPANVRVEELPGLLKRYKEGVPGWELKEADFAGLVGDAKVIPRQDLLDRVLQTSPVHTHKELLLKESPNTYPTTAGGMADLAQRYYSPGSLVRSYGDYDKVLGFNRNSESPWEWGVTVIASDARGNPLPGARSRTHSTPPSELEVRDWFAKSLPGEPKPIGSGEVVSGPKYQAYGQGGKDYTEMLLSQPMKAEAEFGSHWSDIDSGAVAHARFDTHGDALRINELQSDLGIHNRKVREAISSRQGPPQQLPSESDSAYLDRVQEQGYVMQMGDDGEWQWSNDPKSQGIDFPMEDAWMDLFIKRLALEAARGGHRAIEIASPRSIADKVGGNIENYEHAYNKVAPGMLERLGRKMGGLHPDAVSPQQSSMWKSEYDRISAEDIVPTRAEEEYRRLRTAYELQLRGAYSDETARNAIAGNAQRLADKLEMLYEGGASRMPSIMSLAERQAQAYHAMQQAGASPFALKDSPSRRYIMSDEMRKRIITQGIGAAVAAPMVSDDDLIERLNK